MARPRGVIGWTTWISTAVLLLWAVAGATRAHAQPAFAPAAGSVAQEGVRQTHPGHGWVVVPEPRGGGWLLMHLLPRRHAGDDGRLAGSERGTARVVIRLAEIPEGLAAVGNEVFLVFRSSRNARGGTQRLVYSITAVPSGLSDLWAYVPGRHLRAEASLPGEGELRGFVGTPVGPAALIDRGPREPAEITEGEVAEAGGEATRITARPPPDLTLSLLSGGRWRPVALPAPSTADAAGRDPAADRILRRFMLAVSPDGLAVIATRPARSATLWTCSLTLEQVRRPEVERRRLEEQLAAVQSEQERDGDADGELDEQDEQDDLPLSPIEPTWLARGISLPTSAGRGAVLPGGPIALIGSRLVFAHAHNGELSVYSVGPGAAERLAVVGAGLVPDARAPAGQDAASGAGANAARDAETPARIPAVAVGVVGWAESRQIALVLAPASEPGDRTANVLDAAVALRVVELSADTGAALYDGPSRTGSPISRDEFQAIVLVMLGVATILLVWTIRGDRREQVIKLPPASALGAPSRRLLGASVDFLVASILTGWLLGVPLLEVVSLRVVIGPDAHPLGVATLFGVGALLSALCEGFFGGSIGKLVVGLRVAVVTGEGGGTWRPPGLGRALLRNLFRWTLAPFAIMGMSRPDARHGGDRLTGTAVLVRTEAPPTDGGDHDGVDPDAPER